MYGQHQRSRSFSHLPQEQSGLPPSLTGQQQSQPTASTPSSPRESALQSQTPHPVNMNLMEQQGGGSMIDNLLQRMRDAAGITNAGMVAAGMSTTQNGGGNQAEELLLQQQQQQQQQLMMMMMAMNGGGGGGSAAQTAMIQQQMQGMMMPGGSYGTNPYMMNGMGSMYQQQYPLMVNSAVNYMNPYGQQQLYNQVSSGMHGSLMYGNGGIYGGGGFVPGQQTIPGIYGTSIYGTGNNIYGGSSMFGNNTMMYPYDYMGGISGGMGMNGSYPYSSYGNTYRSAVDPYSHGFGARSSLGMGYFPYDSYSKQMYYPERTSSIKSLWSRDHY